MMKKIWIVLLLICTGFTVHAQWFLGGKAGLYVNKTSYELTEDYATISEMIGFEVAPQFGYYFNEKLALGLNLSFLFNTVKIDRKTDSDRTNSFSWRITPVIRYSAFTYKKFSLILEGRIGVGGAQMKSVVKGLPDANTKYSIFEIGVINIAPVLGFRLTKHLQLEAGLNFLNLGYNIQILNVTGEKNTQYYDQKIKQVFHKFNLGFKSSSILIMSQLTVGVIYKF